MDDLEPVPDAASDQLAVLRRWEDSGALWRVLELGADRATVGLFTCDGGEQVGSLTCEGAELVRFLARRDSNDDGSPSPWPGP